MALDKAIERGKEKRKPYHGSKAFDATCRPGGSCPWCIGSRTAKNRERDRRAKQAIVEWEGR